MTLRTGSPPLRTGSLPYEVEILERAGSGGSEALVERVLPLGEQLSIELKLGDGRVLETHLSRERADELELREGEIRFVRLPGPPRLAA